MTTFLYILTFALGVMVGGFTVSKFNPKDVVIKGKVRAKKGATVDFNNNLNNKKDGIFKRTFRRRKRMDAGN